MHVIQLLGPGLCVLLISPPRERCVCIHAVFLDPFNFSHQDPIPEAVNPTRGPKAGGTLITISGRFLDTGSKEDVQVTVGGVGCTV